MSALRGNILNRLVGIIVLLLAGCGSAYLMKQIIAPAEAKQLFRAGTESFVGQDYREADRFSKDLIELSPDDPAAILLRGQILARLHRDAEALPFFRRLTTLDEPYATYGHYQLAEHFYYNSNYPTAEKHYRQFLSVQPDHLVANEHLAFLLQIQGRTWESIPFAQQRVNLGAFTAKELIMVALADSNWVADENISHLNRLRYPHHSLNQLPEVKQAVADNRTSEELALLLQIIDKYPEQIEPLAILGHYYLETGKEREFLAWHQQLPSRANSHPEIWYLRGLWEKDQDENRRAARCFLKALSCSLAHSKSLFQLSQVLSQLPNVEIPTSLPNQVKAASDVSYLITGMMDDVNPDRVRKLIVAMESLGRYQEAAAWCDVVCRFAGEIAWADSERLRFTHLYLNHPESPEARFLKQIKATTLLSPETDPYQLSPPHRTGSEVPVETSPSRVRFENEAASAGLDFQYFNGTTESDGLQHILQATGGASVVLDYDLDGWPDIYLCQSGTWPVDEETNPYRDRLFRNLGGMRFQDVTEHAGLGDARYSQGATAGDLDNDGDPDLIVTNAGGNRFYRNQGDGTFVEETASFPDSFAAETWSMSAACADFNGDGNLDLYVVNYVLLNQVLEITCRANGQPRGCDPTMFDAEQDRVYLNQGDGSWNDVTEQSGFVVPDGKGLGIVAADFDTDGQPEVFIGNDTIANFFFSPVSTTTSNSVRYAERGILSGTALNDQGTAQACMGIASGDVNSDGRLDLFITNFYSDTNTLYLQTSASSFQEQTRQYQLRDNGYYQLGFGTQFLDAELDGDLDLLVANGHIDRTHATGEPDVMPPQFLENRHGVFEEQPATNLGKYFTGKYFGRSLSLLDWNGDSLQDAVVTHLDQPVALLTNRSSPVGRPLKIRLIGRRGNRDAIGVRIKIEQGESVQYRFLQGGDGYLSRNEQRMIVGLNDSNEKVHLTIDWPGGKKQTISLAADKSSVILIEPK
ncbi:MAG: VCBS repeat-containing protein [Planctomycetaceae bacterium]|nr:VCBS repeat-containing protein [Planctomycetaceae bacterium]